MKKTTLTALLFALFASAPAVSFAWDFSCSPKQTTEVSRVDVPNIMIALDKSGSMDQGERVRTCRVCEEPDGDLVEVSGPTDCQPSGLPWELNQTQYYPTNSSVSGYSYTMTFPVVPPRTPGTEVELEVGLVGDFNGSCEYADVYIDGSYRGRINPNNGQCDRTHRRTFTVPESFLADNALTVYIRTNPDGSCGDGVDAFCGTNSAELTLRSNVARYWGSQQWADPCGKEDKWDQAVAALDRIVYESSNLDPDLAAFGLEVYSDDSARILMDCREDGYTEFMNQLNSQSPGGATPTARAIDTARASDCVSGSQVFEVSQTASTRQNSSNQGYDFTMKFENIPAQAADFQMRLGLVGDYNGSCEFADVYADGNYVGRFRPLSGNSCQAASNPLERVFDIPASYVDDGELVVTIDNRGVGDATTNPTCSASADGVNAHCADNQAIVDLLLTPKVVRAAATIVVNDGAPTRGYGGLDPYPATVKEACDHRDVANVYVVGLGSGTDQDFNNIVAAAGGTGTCLDAGVVVDPCDDVSNWADLRGKCTGGFQTDSSTALLSAIAAITAELQCLYDVNFTGSGVDGVPDDPASEYEYLAVEASFIATGPTSVYNVNSSMSDPPGEGWEFNNPNTRRRVQFSDYYCAQVNLNRVSEVSTQLACLCQEATGTECDVPDYQALELCPKGVWACNEGIDFCEPETNCCVPDLPCDTGLEGVCAAGLTACVGPNGATQVCEQQVFPSPEVCDGLDNDCDGAIDNITGTACNGNGGVGRCAPGITTCINGVETCIDQFEPMPELCNGIDDDCNGTTDDIRQSWGSGQFDSYQPPTTGPLCNYNNVCMCPGGVSDNISGVTFDEFFNDWDPVCGCGEGLSEGNFTPAGDSAPASNSSEPQAGCSSTGGSADASWLALLGLIGLLRRRRR